jgi:hypothetical protein
MYTLYNFNTREDVFKRDYMFELIGETTDT